jgi:hypothetical protein
MPGAGSSLDRNDYQLLEQLQTTIERQARATEDLVEATEELAEQLEDQ